jgi:DNA-binding PadR family transcriptional regulator
MLSVLEEIILSAVYRLKENAYGVTIRYKVSEVTHRDLIYGTLYNTLEQLVRKGYVRKTRGEPTGERGGRSRMLYTLTEKGVQALQDARELQKKIWHGLPDTIAE